MKILISEHHYRKILSELLDSEVTKLHEFGYEIVDRFDLGPYIMLLLHNDEEYEVALTTGDEEFTTYDSQVTKSSSQKLNFVKITKRLIDKINEWLSKYGDLTVGSLNKKRTYKYHRIFKSFGLNVSDVTYTEPDENFPESYNFTIHSLNKRTEYLEKEKTK